MSRGRRGRAGTLLPFEFESRVRLVFGAGTSDRAGEFARAFGTRAMIVTDPGIRATGHVARVERSLRAAGVESTVFDGVEENPTTAHVEEATAFAREHRPDLLIGLGGGSSMDCAKGANFLLTNGGRMQDYRGRDLAKKPMLPLIAIPTTAGTGSEAQSYALISDADTHEKMACGDRKASARVAILDPELTRSLPPRVAALTGIDAISHAVESYVTKHATPVSRIFAREAWALLDRAYDHAIHHPNEAEARAAMMLGAHYAGIAIENSMLGAAHSCANPLTAIFDVVHGVAVGAMLPHVVRRNAGACGELYADLVEDAEGRRPPAESAGETLARRLQRHLERGGVPARLSEAGVDAKSIPKMAVMAARQWTAAHNPVALDEGDFVSLYESAF